VRKVSLPDLRSFAQRRRARAGRASPTQSPVAGAPAAPRSSAALDYLSTGQFGNALRHGQRRGGGWGGDTGPRLFRLGDTGPRLFRLMQLAEPEDG
jgi:hypothetical protein